MNVEQERFKQILRENDTSVTAARMEIFSTLLNSSQPLKNGEVAARTPGVNRSSVYRTLELFDRLGVTATLVRGWTPYTELAEPFKPHHHHMTCDVCGTSVDIASQKIENLIAELAREQSFSPTSHHFEIKGVCQYCLSLR